MSTECDMVTEGNGTIPIMSRRQLIIKSTPTQLIINLTPIHLVSEQRQAAGFCFLGLRQRQDGF